MLSVSVQGEVEIGGVLSPALNTERRTVLLTEFGLLTLTNCMLNLKLPCPLSPPSLIQSSLFGMEPPWFVRPSGAL